MNSEYKQFCGNCGAPVPHGSNFCVECGKKIVPIDQIGIQQSNQYPSQSYNSPSIPVNSTTYHTHQPHQPPYQYPQSDIKQRNQFLNFIIIVRIIFGGFILFGGLLFFAEKDEIINSEEFSEFEIPDPELMNSFFDFLILVLIGIGLLILVSTYFLYKIRPVGRYIAIITAIYFVFSFFLAFSAFTLILLVYFIFELWALFFHKETVNLFKKQSINQPQYFEFQ